MASNDGLLEVRLRLQGARQFISETAGAAGAVVGFGEAGEAASAKTRLANLEAKALQQTMYTLRRYTFYATTALFAGAVGAAKLAFTFDETKKSGTDAFTALLGSNRAANKEMSALIGLTHETGLQLGTITGEAEQMQGFGFTIKQVNVYMAALAGYAERTGRGAAGLSSLVEVFDRIQQAGRLTSLDIRSLAAQGIPALSILTRRLHLTATQAAAVRAGKLVIPSSLALPALAGGIGARQQAIGTGLGQQVGIAHSFLSQFLGGGEQGIFSFATRGLERVNKAFAARAGGGSFLGSLDPSGRLLTDWQILTGDVRAFADAFVHVWNVLTRGKAALAVVLGGFGFILRQTTLIRLALEALAYWYLVTRTRMVAFLLVQKGVAAAETVYLGLLYLLDAGTALLAGDWIALNAAFAATPIGLIVIGVAALAFGLYELVKHAGAVGHAFVVAFHAVERAVKSALNFIIGAWDWLADRLTVPSVSIFGHKIGGGSLLPHIPKLDQGGTVDRTGLALVHKGERWSGVGAAVTPLDKGKLTEPLRINLVINLNGEQFATALLKIPGVRDILANGVFQAQSAAEARG